MQKNRKALWAAAFAVLALAAALSVYALYRVKHVYSTLLERIDRAGEQAVDYLKNQVDMDRPVYTFDYSWMDAGQYVAHAFGGIGGDTYTNSLEAFEANYARGHRIFEVDMDYTPGGV